MKRLIPAVLLGVLMIAVLVGGVAARPEASSNENVKVINVATASVITADKTYSTYSWLSNASGYGFEKADIFYDIAGSDWTTMTVDIVLQTSPDGTNWYTHSDSGIGSQLSADGAGYETVDVEGRFFRVKLDLTDPATVTSTVKAVLH